jgi:amidohydrolase
VTGWVDEWLAGHEPDLVQLRRQLHMHPELGWEERATTALLVEQLEGAGLAPKRLRRGTGVVCDLPSSGTAGGALVVLRADIDALPLQDEKEVAYRSRNPGVCHACGHDVHTAAVLGAGLALAGQVLPGPVRLLFQPAEELMPGGALEVVAEGWMEGATAIFGLHCDPALEVGRVGLRSGAITAAADVVEIVVTGPGGHTSRPHNTVDLVHVLSTVATGLPSALSRLVDPRAGLALVWGEVAAGRAHNAIPREGVLQGTLRVLDLDAWNAAPELVRRVVDGLVSPYGAVADVTYVRGVPPVVNDAGAAALLSAAVTAALGPGAAVPTPQSMGGEDFAWYLDHVPGAMARLGVKPPGQERPLDLHQGRFDVDEGAIAVGVRVLVAAALAAVEAG